MTADVETPEYTAWRERRRMDRDTQRRALESRIEELESALQQARTELDDFDSERMAETD